MKKVVLPRPADISTYIESYYQWKYSNDENAGKVIKNLENLLEKSQPGTQYNQYLSLYYGTVIDISDSIYELDQIYSSKIKEVDRWYRNELNEISKEIPTVKKKFEMAFSYGLEAVISFYITQFLMNYVPEDISKDAAGGLMFVSFLGLMWGVHGYYKHKKSKIYNTRAKELNKLKEEYSNKKRALLRRGELRARFYWYEYVEGKLIDKLTVDYISKEDGTSESLIKYIFDKFRELIS